jgi:DNA-directed RNA polymerase specialized sigma24 family protein
MHLFSLDQVPSNASVAEVVDCNSDPALKLEEFEQITVIEKSLARLPIDQRIVLVLRDIEGLTYNRIADITGTNLGTVRSRLYYARLKLRIMLEPYLSGRSLARGLNIEPIKSMEPHIAIKQIPVAVSMGQKQ